MQKSMQKSEKTKAFLQLMYNLLYYSLKRGKHKCKSIKSLWCHPLFLWRHLFMTSDVENSKVLGVGFTVKNNCFNAILEYTIVFNSSF